MHRLVAADGLEVDQQQQVDHRHGRGNCRVGDEGLAVASDARFGSGLLFRRALGGVNLLRLTELGSVETGGVGEDEE